MFAQILAALVALVLNAPPPERLDDPARAFTRTLTEGRVLYAEVAQGTEPGPQLEKATLGPVVRGKAAVVMDLAAGTVLANKEPSAVLPVASLTKLLTALTVAREADPDAVVTVSARAVARGRRGANMRLREGENILVRDLLAGLLIPSANDAAIALAEHVAGSEEVFADKMRTTAEKLGLSRTRVENATGFDDLKHFSSAYDVALLLAEAWQDPLLGLLLRSESMVVRSVDGRQVHRLETTNRLLGKRTDILGGKTGLSEAAGENLAVVAESPSGHPVVAVVLGSPDRFGDMENLLNWTFWAYVWPSESE